METSWMLTATRPLPLPVLTWARTGVAASATAVAMIKLRMTTLLLSSVIPLAKKARGHAPGQDTCCKVDWAAHGHIMLFVVVPGVPIVWGPPWTEPPDAICCWTAWVSWGVTVVAVQLAIPFATEAASALTDTPQTLAATL